MPLRTGWTMPGTGRGEADGRWAWPAESGRNQTGRNEASGRREAPELNVPSGTGAEWTGRREADGRRVGGSRSRRGRQDGQDVDGPRRG